MKGNLCWNGDLEAGTTEGWKNDYWDFLKPTLSVVEGEGYNGSHALKAEAGGETGWYGFYYNEDFPFEECGVYLVDVKLRGGTANCYALILFKDAYKNILGHLFFGVGYTGEWERAVAIVGNLFGASYFSVGFLFYGMSGYYCYVDELSVIGLKHDRNWEWMDTYLQTYSGEGHTIWECNLAVFLKHQYLWKFDVRKLTGTSPSIDLYLQQDIMLDKHDLSDKYLKKLESITGITQTGLGEKVGTCEDYGFYNIRMETTGADTEVEVKHILKVNAFI